MEHSTGVQSREADLLGLGAQVGSSPEASVSS